MIFGHRNPAEEQSPSILHHFPAVAEQSSRLAEHSLSLGTLHQSLRSIPPKIEECSPVIKECSSRPETWADRFCTSPQALRNAPQDFGSVQKSSGNAPQDLMRIKKSSGNAPQAPGNGETAWGNVIGEAVTATPSFRHGPPESRLHGRLQD